MADIIKCRTNTCPMREECYRYTALEPNWPWQSYADFTKECSGVEGFPYFWGNGVKSEKSE